MRLAFALALALCACAPAPRLPSDAAPDSTPADAADDRPEPTDAPELDAAADVVAPLDVPSSPDALEPRDVRTDAGPSTPALDTVFQEQTVWVLFETYPGDGMGTPAIRSSAIGPTFTRDPTPRPGGDLSRLIFRQCAAIARDGCEELMLRARLLDSMGAPLGPPSVCVRLEPMGATVLSNCTESSASNPPVEYREGPRYTDRLGLRRFNACWSAALNFDPARPALWAIRGVPGRTTHPMRGDFCVFGIRD